MLKSYEMVRATPHSEKGELAKELARHGVKPEEMRIYLGPDGLYRGSGLRERNETPA